MYMNRNAPGSGLASLMAMQGRMGDTELVHMNPMEVKMFDSMTPGGLTRNPATGAPEGFAWFAALPLIAKGALIGAAAGGISGLVTKKWSPIEGLFGGAALGSAGAAGLGALGAGAGAVTPAAQAAQAAGLAGTGGTTFTQGALAAQLANPTLATGLAPVGTMFGAAAPTYAGSLAGAGGSLVPAAKHAGILSGASATPFASSTTQGMQNILSQSGLPQHAINQSTATIPKPSLWDQLGQTLTGKGVGTAGKDIGKEAAEETWLQRNRLPVSLGVAGASLLANQQPDFAGIPNLPERSTPRGTGTARVRGREPRDDEIKTTDVLLAEALGPGFDFTEEEEETSGTAAVAQGGLISLQGGGRYIEPGGVEHYSRYGTWGGPAPGSAAYQGRYGTWGQGQVMNQVTTPQISSPKVNPHLVDPIYEQDVRALGFGPELDAERIRQGVRGAGGGGGEPVEEETVESVVDITGRSPRTFTNPDTGGTGELTEQQIVDYMTGVTPGGLPNLLSTPFRGDVASEEEIASQFIGSARGGNVFEGQVHTTGDGMSDDRRFDIVESPKGGGMGFFKDTGTDAVIARDEYVWPADAVAMLGNGSSNAGADILDNTVKQIRQASVGHKHQVNQIDGKKELRKALTT